MNAFPAVDPIPLPAPVELFKILHNVTLALHFIAVQMVIGGLLISIVIGFLARNSNGDRTLQRKSVAEALATRLPVAMTYLINFGVPPLLFLQVLYGRQFYTSSVLIGMFWIAVIFLLMGAYFHLYRYAGDFEIKKISWWKALVAFVLIIAIAKIYSTVMTLMLRPEVWQKMYATSTAGVKLPPHDPTLLPRWLFMITGGLVAGGLWMIWLTGSKNVEEAAKPYFSSLGGKVAAVGVILHVLTGILAIKAQPPAVYASLNSNALFKAAGFIWGAAMLGILVFSIWRGAGGKPSRFIGLILIFVGTLGAVVCRDGIRDITLVQKGFNVMERTIYTNWYVVGIFLITFVVGLVAVGWLISVMMRAKQISQK
ncbi:MAG: hypothetical protein N2487_04815 [Verrucomicrobiae bacterium]|nr:hypothetical protein [Verrucomicrobiae bacterium]